MIKDIIKNLIEKSYREIIRVIQIFIYSFKIIQIQGIRLINFFYYLYVIIKYNNNKKKFHSNQQHFDIVYIF